MNLFQYGDFTSSAGLTLGWKIECDQLSVGDWECIAKVCAPYVAPFRFALGVPTGGDMLAAAMQPYGKMASTRVLICDDVWTTGKSMRDHARSVLPPDVRWIGLVAFARGELPSNVKAFMECGL